MAAPASFAFSNRDADDPPGGQRVALLWLVPLFALLAAVVWGGALRNGYVWDDEYFLLSNRALRDWSFLPRYFTDADTMAGRGYGREFVVFRPLRNISFLLDFKLTGLAPAWCHGVNVVLHMLNALLLTFIARRLTGRLAPGVLCGLVFLLHPVQSEAVVWVKGRDDMLVTFLVLTGFALWLRWRLSLWRRGRFLGIGLVYALACLAKESGTVLPALLLAYEFIAGRRNDPPARVHWKSLWGFMGFLAAVGVAYILWRHLLIGRTGQVDYTAASLMETMLTMTRVGVRYLVLLVFPRTLIADYVGTIGPSHSLLEWRVLGSIAVLLAVAVGAVAVRRRAPLVTFGLAWLAIALLPVSNVVAVAAYMAERFLYLPLAGFALAVGAGYALVPPRHVRWAAGLALVILAAFAIRSAARVPAWRDGIALFTQTVRDTPPGARRPRRNLVVNLMNAGRFEDALPLARPLWEQGRDNAALPARERAKDARNLAYLLARTGKSDEAAPLWEEAIRMDPTYVQPLLDLGVRAGAEGDHAAALAWFERALAEEPGDPFVLFNRAVALREAGRMDEAEAAFREAGRFSSDAGAHKSLGALLWGQGRIREALAVYEEAARLFPADEEVRHWRDRAREIVARQGA